MTCSRPGSGAPPVADAVLGIDLGTSALKALALTADGAEPGRGSASYQVRTPCPGYAETDPEDWWRAAQTAVRQAAAESEPKAIAVTGQMHGVVLTDDEGAPVRPAIVWLDRRATEEAAGYPAPHASPGMAGPVLRWLSRHEPETYYAARWALQPKDWLRMRLTGRAATDPTDASATLLYDMARDTWADTPDAHLLPPIHPSGALAGHLTPGAASELGLTPGLPVATGAADTAASLLAAELPGPGWALLTLGTGGQWIVPVPADAPPDPTGRTNLFRAVDGGAYRLAGVQNVGVALDWVRRVLRASWDELYRSAARGARSSPLFRPYLVPERYDITGVASWTELTLSHTREDLLNSALTGVAALLRDHLDNLRAAGADPREVMIAGGGGGDPAWRELLSDTLGLPLREAPDRWLTVRGAALIARSLLSAV